MWDLPGPGLKPVSRALAGRFLTTAPPGKPPPAHSFLFLIRQGSQTLAILVCVLQSKSSLSMSSKIVILVIMFWRLGLDEQSHLKPQWVGETSLQWLFLLCGTVRVTNRRKQTYWFHLTLVIRWLSNNGASYFSRSRGVVRGKTDKGASVKKSWAWPASSQHRK